MTTYHPCQPLVKVLRNSDQGASVLSLPTKQTKLQTSFPREPHNSCFTENLDLSVKNLVRHHHVAAYPEKSTWSGYILIFTNFNTTGFC